MQFKIVFVRPRNERKHLSSISLLRLQLLAEIFPRLFLLGNTFLRQRLSCQSICQQFSRVRGIISQLCHKHFLLYQALYSNIPFYRQLLLKPVSLWLPKQNTFFLLHKTCSLKLAEKNEQWISADVTTELRSVLNWQSARSIRIGLP